METIKNIFIDSLNGFSAKDIPLFLFQILMAALLAHVFQLVVNKKWKSEVINHSALMSTTIAILAAIVKYALPFAVLALAVILWFKPKTDASTISKLSMVIVGMIGVGCGVGSVVLTTLGFGLLLLIILFTPLKSSE
ncbi:MAG: hypothetical protein ACWA41_06835 [Putridiphycobacter sp.]